MMDAKHTLKYSAVLLAAVLVFEMGVSPVYASETAQTEPVQEETMIVTEETEAPAQAFDEEAAKNLEDELSKNGNAVTQYVNEEDQKLKTIVWAKGITPPEMGTFVKESDSGSGGAQYITYKAPYQANNGWYDVNKTIGRVEDANLCFADEQHQMLFTGGLSKIKHILIDT